MPAQFGGGPCDYQLVEEEGAGGQTRLTLRIHPRLGALDEARILSRFVEELGKADRNQRFVTACTSPRGMTLSVHLTVGKE
jgi:hypothetical protein